MTFERTSCGTPCSTDIFSHFDKSSFTLANQSTFGMHTVQAHGKGDFFEDKHVDTNAIVLFITRIPAFCRSIVDKDLTAIFPKRLSNRNVSSSVGLTIMISGDSHQSVMNTSSFAVRSALATDSMYDLPLMNLRSESHLLSNHLRFFSPVGELFLSNWSERIEATRSGAVKDLRLFLQVQ